MEKIPQATREMIRFVAEFNSTNNENSNKREKILSRLRNKREQIAEAMIGFGISLKSLGEQKELIEEELKNAEKEMAWKDPNAAFMKKFGMPMWGINLNPTPTQEQIDSSETEED